MASAFVAAVESLATRLSAQAVIEPKMMSTKSSMVVLMASACVALVESLATQRCRFLAQAVIELKMVLTKSSTVVCHRIAENPGQNERWMMSATTAKRESVTG
jgi:NAD(P)H-dependent flavin oxidoreductase YrpB (nitropropane dioxygenase family)